MNHLNELTSKEVFPGFKGKFIHGNLSTVAFWEIKEGSRVPLHHHIHEQVTHIIEGELQMNIGGVKYNFTAGSVHVIPSNVEHDAIAISNSKVIDVFTPVREDYRF